MTHLLPWRCKSWSPRGVRVVCRMKCHLFAKRSASISSFLTVRQNQMQAVARWGACAEVRPASEAGRQTGFAWGGGHPSPSARARAKTGNGLATGPGVTHETPKAPGTSLDSGKSPPVDPSALKDRVDDVLAQDRRGTDDSLRSERHTTDNAVEASIEQQADEVLARERERIDERVRKTRDSAA